MAPRFLPKAKREFYANPNHYFLGEFFIVEIVAVPSERWRSKVSLTMRPIIRCHCFRSMQERILCKASTITSHQNVSLLKLLLSAESSGGPTLGASSGPIKWCHCFRLRQERVLCKASTITPAQNLSLLKFLLSA